MAKKAIVTKFIGATTLKGHRCKASDQDGNYCYLEWDNKLDPEEMHRCTAAKLKNRMNLEGELVTGSIKDAYVHVFR